MFGGGCCSVCLSVGLSGGRCYFNLSDVGGLPGYLAYTTVYLTCVEIGVRAHQEYFDKSEKKETRLSFNGSCQLVLCLLEQGICK